MTNDFTNALAGLTAEQRSGLAHELFPNGSLRVGVVVAPAASALFVTHDQQSGDYFGVPVDLAKALAEKLAVPLAITAFSNSGACTEALAGGEIDLSFMPVDEERRKRVAFGTAYYILESTYLVGERSGIKTLADVDRTSVRVVGIANTTTIRSAARTLSNTIPTPVASIAEAVDMMRTGAAEALALSRDAFRTLLPLLPGAYVLDGGFQSTGIAIAVKQNSPVALSIATAFLETAKAAGLVRSALDKAGFGSEAVAPAGV
jgi:polar amino acid transport system substrate-binding protein